MAWVLNLAIDAKFAPTERPGFQFNKKGGVQIGTPPQIKKVST
jgi:hypothetical protein